MNLPGSEDPPDDQRRQPAQPRPDIRVVRDPATYRNVLASELSVLRPGLPVALTEPAGVDSAVARIHLRLVICTQVIEIVP